MDDKKIKMSVTVAFVHCWACCYFLPIKIGNFLKCIMIMLLKIQSNK
jgi:hypothetical protein